MIFIHIVYINICQMNSESLNLKQLLINILNTINPYWDLAEWFLTIVQNTDDDSLIKYLLIEIQDWIKSIKSKKSKEEIKRKIKKISEENNKKDKEEADKMLEDFIKSI